MNKTLAIIIMLSLLSWGLALPVGAAQMTSVSDTISDSDKSATADHTIAWTSSNAAAAAETITITWEAGFDISAAVTSTISGMTSVSGCDVAGDEVTSAISGQVLTFTVCSGDEVAAGAISVKVTGVVNPSSAASYDIDIGGTQTDSGKAMVAIIDDVSVTATVDTHLTFTVAAKNSGNVGSAGVLCDDNTATPTSLPFGTLAVDTAEIACQTLAVTTNAKNGFVVTVLQDARLVSASGADIDTFKDDAETAVPVAWASPSATLDTETTYGHMGVTSSDDLNSDEFGDGLNYAGNLLSARQVFSHTGPADGSTAQKGSANVGYMIEVDDLQEAADDYSATLTYVATPTF